jgi:hypothetical protein
MAILSNPKFWTFLGSAALEIALSQRGREWGKEKIEETLRSVRQSLRSSQLSQEALRKLYQGRDKADDLLRTVNEKGHEHGRTLYSRMN